MRSTILGGLIVATIAAFVLTPLSNYIYSESETSKIDKDQSLPLSTGKLEVAAADKQKVELEEPIDLYILKANKITEIEGGSIFIHVGIPTYNRFNVFEHVDIAFSSPGKDLVSYQDMGVGALLKYESYEFRFMEYGGYYLKLKLSRLNKSSKKDSVNAASS